MAKLKILASPQIVSGETSITQDVFEAHASEGLKRGGLCYLSDGALQPVRTTAGELKDDDSPMDAAQRLFIALQDAEEGSGKVKATEIKEDTILEGFVVDTEGDDVKIDQDEIGNRFRGYVNADGKWAINNVKDDGVFEIVDVQDNYMPYRQPDDEGFDVAVYSLPSGSVRHGRVQFKVRKDRLK